MNKPCGNSETREDTEKLFHKDLTFRAFDIVTGNLSNFGNQLGEEHETALMELVGGFTFLAFGLKKGCYAYPLPAGMGKTGFTPISRTHLKRLIMSHDVSPKTGQFETTGGPLLTFPRKPDSLKLQAGRFVGLH